MIPRFDAQTSVVARERVAIFDTSAQRPKTLYESEFERNRDTWSTWPSLVRERMVRGGKYRAVSRNDGLNVKSWYSMAHRQALHRHVVHDDIIEMERMRHASKGTPPSSLYRSRLFLCLFLSIPSRPCFTS